MSNVLPYRSRPVPTDRDYATGWSDGADFAERVHAWRWRLEGAITALAAVGCIALSLYLTGGFR